MDELIIEYLKKFNENFPSFAVKAKPESEIIDILKNCIETNTPYEVELNPYEALY